MELTFSCSPEDIEFIELIKKEFSDKGTVEEFKVKGITAYATVMLVLQISSTFAALVIPFIVANMTSNKDNRIKSKRCFIDNNNKTISFEGYDDVAITQIIEKAIQEQSK